MNHVDFTPQWYQARLQSACDRKRRLGYLGVICALMVGWWVVSEGRIQSADANLQTSQTDRRQAEVLQQRLVNLRTKKSELEALNRRFESMASGITKSTIFAEISHRMPATVRLADFELATLDVDQKPTMRGGRVAVRSRGSLPRDVHFSDVKVSFNAQAPDYRDLTDFVLKLEDSSLFEKVQAEGNLPTVVGGKRVLEKKIDLYVYRKEYFAP